MSEIADSAQRGGRTWFVTLTFAPAFRSRISLAAERSIGGKEWGELSSEKRTAALAKEAQSFVTLWLKRVREESGAAFRYLLVTEAHKDGFPHIHLLISENGVSPLRHAVLSRQWRYGYSNAKLVDSDDPRAAEYATKYLSKSPVTRVRASVGYGHGDGDKAPSGHRP